MRDVQPNNTDRVPRQFYPWYVTSLLTVAYLVSLLDRYVMSLVIELVKADLVLSDFQMGLLLGPAFGVLYITLGIPFGWLADRSNRKWMVTGGILVWSLMTAACAFSTSFAELLAARIGVGVGEAVLAPCALSLISDYFRQRNRAKAISVFMNGIFLGGGLAYVVGGQLVDFVGTSWIATLPKLSNLAPWQLVFVVAATPGVVLLVLMFTMREPARETSAGEGGGVLETAAYFATHWRSFACLLAAMSAILILGYTAFWGVAFYQRTWAMPVGNIGLVYGLLMIGTGFIGTTFSGWRIDRMTKDGRSDGPISIIRVSALVLVPGYALFPLVDVLGLSFVLLAAAMVGQASATAAGAAALIGIAPSRIRAQATAIYWTITNIVGLFIGPVSVGWLTDLYGDPSDLKYSLSTVGVLCGGMAIVALRLGQPFYLKHAGEMGNS